MPICPSWRSSCCWDSPRTATLTYAAGRQLGSGAGNGDACAAPAPPIVVPDVEGQAFVFAKGALEDAGFAWRVVGSVHGYAANTVVSQSPAPGTRVIDTGAPLDHADAEAERLATAQTGEAQDAAPYAATALQPAALASGHRPGASGTDATATTPTPAATTTTATPDDGRSRPRRRRSRRRRPRSRLLRSSPRGRRPARVAFAVAGARAEPLDEMPLPNRAQLLRRWLDAHPKKTTHATSLTGSTRTPGSSTGAKLGWWRGAEAL